jgi:hypothetical protein
MLQNIKKLVVGVIIASGLSASFAFADTDCPPPNEIVKSCSPQGSCNWMTPAGPWEGFPYLLDNHDTKITTFEKAYWWDYRGTKLNKGDVVCEYRGDKGSLIRMNQTKSWGEVPKPTGTDWTPFTYLTQDAVACESDRTSCRFIYY